MKNGFTLIELLTGLGITATLVGIALPTLAHARNNARDAKCKSNLREIATARSMYYMEAKNPIQSVWTTFLDENDDGRIFTCPSNKKPEDGSYVLHLPAMQLNGVYRPQTVQSYFDNGFAYKIPLVSDMEKYHGWKNSGYMDGHAGRNYGL